MFVKLIILLFVSCFAAWGQTKYLPFKGDEVQQFLELENELARLSAVDWDQLTPEDKETIQKKRDKLERELRIFLREHRSHLMAIPPLETTDLTKLPLTGLTERELIPIAESGNGAASMELAFRWFVRRVDVDDSSYAVYTQVHQWLSLAREQKHPGAEFLWNLLFTPPLSRNLAESGNPHRNIPGFEEFDRLLNEGDILSFKMLSSYQTLSHAYYPEYRNNPRYRRDSYYYYIPSIEEWLKSACARLEQKAKSGDINAQRSYIIWSCIDDHLGSKEVRDQWFDQLVNKEDMELTYYWLRQYRPKTYTIDYAEKVLDLCLGLYNAGYLPAHEKTFYFVKLSTIFHSSMFPEMDVLTLHKAANHYLYERGSLNELAFANVAVSYDDEGRAEIFPKYIEALGKTGSGSLYVGLLSSYPRTGMFNFIYHDYMGNEVIYTTILPQAEKGRPEAIVAMAACYMDGIEVKQDMQKAHDLWVKALECYTPLDRVSVFDFSHMIVKIKMNLARCKINLAGDDERVKEEIAASLKALEEEIAQREREASAIEPSDREVLYFLLGYIYETGFGVPIDLEKAVSYYEQAPNTSEALNNLGYMYEEGLGVEQDFRKAEDLFKAALEKAPKWPLHHKSSEAAQKNVERFSSRAR